MAAAISGAAATQVATPVVEGTPEAPANLCEASSPGVGAEPWIRTELSFGATLPDGSEITPRFPDGLTVLAGYGQFLDSEGIIAGETSIVPIIFHSNEFVVESSASIGEIRDIYEVEFEQESVLRVDSEPVCVSFQLRLIMFVERREDVTTSRRPSLGKPTK